MKMAAIVSGCYVLTSNRSGMDSKGQEFGGRGWIVDPNGDMVAQTSAASSVATYTVDLDHVATAQREYPCYVRE
jgi:N-carbamoylputrescine amidase